MSTGASRETLARFHRGEFWEALDDYILERQTKNASHAINCTTWDGVVQCKGAHAELSVLKRLQGDLDNFVRESKTPKESQK